jgi:hypothetical protein
MNMEQLLLHRARWMEGLMAEKAKVSAERGNIVYKNIHVFDLGQSSLAHV